MGQEAPQDPSWERAVPSLPGRVLDVVATSPVYGNRLSDAYNAQDPSKRHSYTFDLGRKLHPDNIGATYFWQPDYKLFYEKAWTEVRRVLKPRGLFVLNISNCIHDGVEQPVTEWHTAEILSLGFDFEDSLSINTPRMRHGQNGEARVEGEWVLSFRRGSTDS